MHCCGRKIRFEIWKRASKIPSKWRFAIGSRSGNGNTTGRRPRIEQPSKTPKTRLLRGAIPDPAVTFTTTKRQRRFERLQQIACRRAEITGTPPIGHRRFGYCARSRVLREAAMLT
jgi:hypothetical protein